MPWFSGWTGGIGATAGYIFGFILAALFLGHFADGYLRAHRLITILGLMLLANFVFIYVPGVVWLSYWVGVVKGTPADWVTLLGMGVIPFIPGDLTKAFLAAVIARGVTPHKTS